MATKKPELAFPGVWSPSARVTCYDCHGPTFNRGFGDVRLIEGGAWVELTSKQPIREDEALTRCDNCNALIFARDDVAYANNVLRFFCGDDDTIHGASDPHHLNSDIGGGLQQTGGMCSAVYLRSRSLNETCADKNHPKVSEYEYSDGVIEQEDKEPMVVICAMGGPITVSVWQSAHFFYEGGERMIAEAHFGTDSPRDGEPCVTNDDMLRAILYAEAWLDHERFNKRVADLYGQRVETSGVDGNYELGAGEVESIEPFTPSVPTMDDELFFAIMPDEIQKTASDDGRSRFYGLEDIVGALVDFCGVLR